MKILYEYEENLASCSWVNGGKPCQPMTSYKKMAAPRVKVGQMCWYANHFWWWPKRSYSANLKVIHQAVQEISSGNLAPRSKVGQAEVKSRSSTSICTGCLKVIKMKILYEYEENLASCSWVNGEKPCQPMTSYKNQSPNGLTDGFQWITA